jgi:hypothetical protein
MIGVQLSQVRKFMSQLYSLSLRIMAGSLTRQARWNVVTPGVEDIPSRKGYSLLLLQPGMSGRSRSCNPTWVVFGSD